MICKFCKHIIKGEPFYLYGDAFCVKCVAKQIRCERRALKEEKAAKEQRKLTEGVWHING